MYYLLVYDKFDDGKEQIYTCRTFESFEDAKKFAVSVMQMELASRVILCKYISELIECELEE